jgi:hypothetical protein
MTRAGPRLGQGWSRAKAGVGLGLRLVLGTRAKAGAIVRLESGAIFRLEPY